MPHTLSIPATGDILCEGCGYILSGLPLSGNCPECGRTIRSSVEGYRRPSAFEIAPSVLSFFRTSAAVLLRPGRFFSTISARHDNPRSIWLTQGYRFLAASLLAVAASGHIVLTHLHYRVGIRSLDEPFLFTIMLPPLALLFYGIIAGLTWAAEHAITWAAGRGGLRITRSTARRALAFHAIHITPVALLLAATVCGAIGLGEIGYFDMILLRPQEWPPYRYALLAEVAAGALYLLLTGWIAIKHMRYVNP